MNSQQGGKSKSSKSSTSKSKKGGNFLGTVSELFVPTGWESFATAAGLLAIDRADAAFRRNKKTSKKMKGGEDVDGHETIETLEKSMRNQQSKGGRKKSATKTSKKTTKKGGNFLGTVGELVAPTGWETFATTAGLFALDRADAALRRGKKKQSSKKMKGGADVDGHETIEHMEQMMEGLGSGGEMSSPQQMNGGGKKSSKKTTSKKSSKKGGNFLGTVGELVAPSGWETFATTAGLFALDRADAALRRGKKEKKEKMKGGTVCGSYERTSEVGIVFDFFKLLKNNEHSKYLNIPTNTKKNTNHSKFIISFIESEDKKYSLQVLGTINGTTYTYCNPEKYSSIEEAREKASDTNIQIIIGKRLLRNIAKNNPNFKIPSNF